jgi:hypothetical protein
LQIADTAKRFDHISPQYSSSKKIGHADYQNSGEFGLCYVDIMRLVFGKASGGALGF